SGPPHGLPATPSCPGEIERVSIRVVHPRGGFPGSPVAAARPRRRGEYFHDICTGAGCAGVQARVIPSSFGALDARRSRYYPPVPPIVAFVGEAVPYRLLRPSN